MKTGAFTRLIVGIFVSVAVAGHAQQPQIGVPVPPLGAGPFVFDTAEQHKISWCPMLYLLTDEDEGALLRIEPAS